MYREGDQAAASPRGNHNGYSNGYTNSNGYAHTPSPSAASAVTANLLTLPSNHSNGLNADESNAQRDAALQWAEVLSFDVEQGALLEYTEYISNTLIQLMVPLNEIPQLKLSEITNTVRAPWWQAAAATLLRSTPKTAAVETELGK